MKTISQNPLVELLRTTDFPKLWASQILTQVGINLLNFVLVLRIFERTHSSFAVSLVWLFYVLPAILIGPFAGTLIDFVSRRRLLIFTTVAQAATVLLFLLIRNSVWPIYAVIFIYAIFTQLYIPTEAATLPSLVKKNFLPFANTLFLLTIYASIILGFGLAGPVVALAGRKMPFLIVTTMLALAAVAVSLLPKDKRKDTVGTPLEFWSNFNEGYAFIRGNPGVLLPLLLLVLAGILVPIVGILSPAIATKILRVDFLEVSTRFMLPLGVGAILGGFLAAKFLKNTRKKVIIGAGLLLGALSLFYYGVTDFGLTGLAFRATLGSIGAFFLGVALAFSVVPGQTLLQERTPPRMRGRVFGVLGFSITLASFLPVMSLAALTEFFGESAILIGLSLILFLAAVAAFNYEPLVRRLYA